MRISFNAVIVITMATTGCSAGNEPSAPQKNRSFTNASDANDASSNVKSAKPQKPAARLSEPELADTGPMSSDAPPAVGSFATPVPTATAVATAMPAATVTSVPTATPTPEPTGVATSVTPSTKGSGGVIGFQMLTSTGGLKYQMNAAAPQGGRPQGLLVLLHGSTASNYDKFVGLMQGVSEKYDLIRVSVLAPNGQGWNEGAQPAAADLLNRLVQEDLYPKFNIATSKVFFSGQSSGGGFLSSHFIPMHGKNYRGGAFLQCGAAPPAVTFTPDAATKAGLRLHFEITTGDQIWPASYASSVAAYSSAGMLLTKDNTKPGGHCAFDQQQVILDHIAAMIAP